MFVSRLVAFSSFLLFSTAFDFTFAVMQNGEDHHVLGHYTDRALEIYPSELNEVDMCCLPRSATCAWLPILLSNA